MTSDDISSRRSGDFNKKNWFDTAGVCFAYKKIIMQDAFQLKWKEFLLQK